MKLAQEDYYRAEEPGRWCGLGAELRGLKGTVERELFRDALDGTRVPAHDADHVMTAPRRRAREGRADQSGSTGEKYRHGKKRGAPRATRPKIVRPRPTVFAPP